MLKPVHKLELGDKFLYTYDGAEHIVEVAGPVLEEDYVNNQVKTFRILCETEGRKGYMLFSSGVQLPLVFKKKPARRY